MQHLKTARLSTSTGGLLNIDLLIPNNLLNDGLELGSRLTSKQGTKRSVGKEVQIYARDYRLRDSY